MIPPLAALGSFVFAPSNGSYEDMERTWETPRASLGVIGRSNVKHWMGPGDEFLRLSGSIWPEIQLPGLSKIDDIGAMAKTGRALPFVLATGQYLGMWGISHTSKTSSEFMHFGFPGEITFEIELERV